MSACIAVSESEKAVVVHIDQADQLAYQSGPPHRMATFAIEMPGWERMCLIARIDDEFTPTS